MARIDLFRMERMQARYWHQVEYDLSESGVTPLSIEELLGTSTTPAICSGRAWGIHSRRARSVHGS